MSVGIKRRQRGRFATAGLAVAGLVAALTACGGSQESGSGTAGGACDVDGVTDTSVALGAITSVSGSYNYSGPFADGVKARIEAVNAAGGINGRRLELQVADDASEVANNLAASRSLVEGKKVVGIMTGSSFTAGGGDYLKQAGLPVTGYGVTKEYETIPNFIPYANTMAGASNSTSTTRLFGDFLKSKGGTVVYAVGSGTPQGAAAATALIAGAEAVGLKKGVLTTDLPIGTTNYTGEAQKAKEAGVDALALPLGGAGSVAVLKAMKQGEVPVKTALLMAGYDPGILKEAADVLEGSTFIVFFSPFEVESDGMKAYKDALAAYTKAPVGQYTMNGWLAADLMVTGIEKAGDCPSRENVLAAINGLKGYTAKGLLPPTDFVPDRRGDAPLCGYFVTVEKGAFAPENDGKPLCAGEDTQVPVTR